MSAAKIDENNLPPKLEELVMKSLIRVGSREDRLRYAIARAAERGGYEGYREGYDEGYEAGYEAGADNDY